MLPDLPVLKRDLWEIWIRYLQRQIQANLGVFQDAGKYSAHEGDRLRVVRADGTVEDSDFKRASSEMVISMDRVSKLTPQERLKQLDRLAREMGDQMKMHLFESLSKTLDEAGQVIDGQGKPFDHESVFSALESIQIDFDETGQHSPLSMVHPPALTERVAAAFRLIETDPALMARYAEIIARKKVEWHDRESARKLVG